ncbi:MAG TPA: PA14 domain-containing protein, partial [Gemmataceae bacterium]
GAAFQCVITGPHGTVKTRPARLWVTRLREPVEPGPLAAGLHYEAHAGSWPALPPFEPATRVKAGVAPGFDVGLRPRGEHFGLVFTGFLDVDRDGAYTFRLGASGAAKLFVAGAEVASLGMANGPRSASGTVGLRAGKHPIRLHFAHGGGRPLLEVRCSGPGLAEQPIPAAKLFRPERAGAGSARARPLAVTLNVPARPEDLPPLLSQTGIFCSLEDLTPQAGVVPYDVNTPLWSDGALKRRWIALPGDERIGFAGHGAWKFPAGTVLIKHFEFGDEQAPPGKRRRLETRLLVVDRTGLGYGVTYRWRDDQRDAELLPDGLTEDVTFATPSGERARRWTYPSRGECLVCHTPQAGFVLGVNTRQLNRPFPDPGSGKSENQLRAWSRAGMFDRELPEAAVAGFPRLAALDDVTASLEHRARSYLDANCAQCHRPGGARGDFDLRFEIPLARQRLIGGKLESADLGIAGAAVVVPGDRSRSMIYQRMSRRRDVFNMPPLATHEVDAEACEVIGRWIDSLTGTSAPTGKSPRPKKPKTPEPLGAALAPSRFVSGSLR